MPVILSSLRSMTGSIVREWRLERPMRFTGLILLLVLVVLWISIRLLSMMEFSNLDMDTFSTLQPQQIANAVGVQGQIFTIVNDESYFYPDMIRGWIVDGDYGSDIAYYTGSTTGTSRNNQICSQYTPITWQVDRKCHMISASSFDKLCYDMKQQRDDMTYYLHAHGARELVKDTLVANNQQRKLHSHSHAHTHAHSHSHLDDHDHDHDQEWF